MYSLTICTMALAAALAESYTYSKLTYFVVPGDRNVLDLTIEKEWGVSLIIEINRRENDCFENLD